MTFLGQRRARLAALSPALAFSIVASLAVGVAPAYGATLNVCASGCSHTTIQAAVDAATANDTIQVAADTFTENVTITKPLSLVGAGSGSTGSTTIDPGTGFAILVNLSAPDQTVSVQGFDITAPGAAGIQLSSSTELGSMVLSDVNVHDSLNKGFATGDSTILSTLEITDSIFSGNGTAGTGGSADIALKPFTGNATLTNVTITGGATGGGGSAHYAIQLKGTDDCAAPTEPIGSVALSNVSISGTYQQPPLYVQCYTDLAGMSFSGVTVNGPIGSGWAEMFVGNIHNGTPTPTLDLGDTNFVGANATNISLGSPTGSLNVDATSVLFDGDPVSSDPFAAEDAVTSQLDDDTGRGLVTFVTGNVYVTSASGSIQRGVDAAASGDTVNIAAGTYVEQLQINKGVTLAGAGTDVSTVQAPVVGMTISDNSAYYMGTRGTTKAIVRITASDAVVSGLRITPDDQALGDHGSHLGVGVLVDHVGDDPPDALTGIEITGNLVDGVNPTDNFDAVRILGDATATVSGNTFHVSGSGHGVRVNGAEDIASTGPVYPTVDVTGNTIHAGTTPRPIAGSEWSGIFFGIFYISGASGTASGNTIHSAYGWALNAWDAGDVAFTDNTVDTDGDPDRPDNGHGAQLIGSNNRSSTITFNNNEISGKQYAAVTSQGHPLTLTAQSNTITDTDDGFVFDNVPGGTFNINKNSFDVAGMAIAVGEPGDPLVAGYGNWSGASEISIDATDNWWGSAAGPVEGAVLGEVDTVPWCTNTACTSFSDDAPPDDEEETDPDQPPGEVIEETEEEAGENETVSTDPEGAGPSVDNPVVSTVTTPNGGTVAIKVIQSPPADDGDGDGGVGDPSGEPDEEAEDSGFRILDYVIDIEAPPATPEAPLVLDFQLDESLFVTDDGDGSGDGTGDGGSGDDDGTPGSGGGFVQVFRNGEPVATCADPDAGVAEPDPCVIRSDAGGIAGLTVLTSQASVWTFATITGGCPAGLVPEDDFGDVAAGAEHESSVDCLDWWGLTEGIAAGQFGPTLDVTRGQMASFVARLLTEAGVVLADDPADAFGDDDASVHELAIDRLAAAGVVEGVTGRRFVPGRAVTRAETATMLVGAYAAIAGAPLPAGPDAFGDDDGSVHADNIDAAAAAGITEGVTATRFAPAQVSTRGEMASLLVGLLDALVADGHTEPPIT